MRSFRNELGELIWDCLDCDYRNKKKTNIFRHVEAKHVLCQYVCHICSATMSCRNSLKQHVIRVHRAEQPNFAQ